MKRLFGLTNLLFSALTLTSMSAYLSNGEAHAQSVSGRDVVTQSSSDALVIITGNNFLSGVEATGIILGYREGKYYLLTARHSCNEQTECFLDSSDIVFGSPDGILFESLVDEQLQLISSNEEFDISILTFPGSEGEYQAIGEFFSFSFSQEISSDIFEVYVEGFVGGDQSGEPIVIRALLKPSEDQLVQDCFFALDIPQAERDRIRIGRNARIFYDSDPDLTVSTDIFRPGMSGGPIFIGDSLIGLHTDYGNLGRPRLDDECGSIGTGIRLRDVITSDIGIQRIMALFDPDLQPSTELIASDNQDGNLSLSSSYVRMLRERRFQNPGHGNN